MLGGGVGKSWKSVGGYWRVLGVLKGVVVLVSSLFVLLLKVVYVGGGDKGEWGRCRYATCEGKQRTSWLSLSFWAQVCKGNID